MLKLFTRNRTLSIALSALFTPLFSTNSAQSNPITYKEIGDSLISASGIVEENKKELTEQDKAQLRKEIRPLSQQEKLSNLFGLLETAEIKVDSQDMPTITFNAMRILSKELELFFGLGEDTATHLFSKIDHTRTVFGKAALAHMLTQPIDDIQLLKKRQTLVMELVNNNELFKLVDNMVSNLATGESDLLSFWQAEDMVGQLMRRSLYFNLGPLKKLNNNSIALSLSKIPETFLILLNTVTTAAVGYPSAKNAYYGFRFSKKNLDTESKRNLLIGYKKATPFPFALVSPILNRFKKGREIVKNITLDLERFISSVKAADDYIIDNFHSPEIEKYIEIEKCIQEKTVNTVSTAIWAALYGFSMKQIINLKLLENTTLKYMQTRLTGARKLLDAAQQIQKLRSSYSVIADGLFFDQKTEALLTHRSNNIVKLARLINLLKTNTFNGSYSYFSPSGRILAAFNLMQEYKNEFAPLMQAVGELDACLSIAKLYKKLQDNNNATYCFVEFVEQDSPYLQLKEFWNPFINPATVVANNIELGAANGPRNAIVTGSNTGGKSTILKAAAISVLLSRLGIAPARKAVMTPFTYVASSLNIGDDTAAGISLFNAEVLRAQKILEHVKSLKKDQHAFIIIDELFVGTASEQGETAACKFIQHLNTFGNTIFIFATHFKKATELEAATNGVCKNYKVDIFKEEDGTLVRPFKLEEGISTSNVANEVLQQNISGISFM